VEATVHVPCRAIRHAHRTDCLVGLGDVATTTTTTTMGEEEQVMTVTVSRI
jgi:hypothetical protein